MAKAFNPLIQGDRINLHSQIHYHYHNPETRVIRSVSYGFLGTSNLYSPLLTHSVLGSYEIPEPRKRKVSSNDVSDSLDDLLDDSGDVDEEQKTVPHSLTFCERENDDIDDGEQTILRACIDSQAKNYPMIVYEDPLRFLVEKSLPQNNSMIFDWKRFKSQFRDVNDLKKKCLRYLKKMDPLPQDENISTHQIVPEATLTKCKFCSVGELKFPITNPTSCEKCWIRMYSCPGCFDFTSFCYLDTVTECGECKFRTRFGNNVLCSESARATIEKYRCNEHAIFPTLKPRSCKLHWDRNLSNALMGSDYCVCYRCATIFHSNELPKELPKGLYFCKQCSTL